MADNEGDFMLGKNPTVNLIIITLFFIFFNVVIFKALD